MAGSHRRLSAMIQDMDAQPAAQSAGNRSPGSSGPATPVAPGGGSTVDEMSECSFPASDPPAVWNWEPKSPHLATTEPPADS
jgi:hypothetical protein